MHSHLGKTSSSREAIQESCSIRLTTVHAMKDTYKHSCNKQLVQVFSQQKKPKIPFCKRLIENSFCKRLIENSFCKRLTQNSICKGLTKTLRKTHRKTHSRRLISEDLYKASHRPTSTNFCEADFCCWYCVCTSCKLWLIKVICFQMQIFIQMLCPISSKICWTVNNFKH